MLLKENSTSTYDFGCTMLYFDFPEIKEVHSIIDPSDLYMEEEDKTYGLEDEPHVTLLYGLHDDKINIEEIKEIINKFTFESCLVHNASLFYNEKYEVLKFDVKGDNLQKINSLLRKLPYTNNYPEYHPHMTLGYLQNGKGQKYVDLLQGLNWWLIPLYVIYSKPNGDKIRININID